MAKHKLAVSGLLRSEASMVRAVMMLKEAGFLSHEVSCLLPRMRDEEREHERSIEQHSLFGAYAGAAGGALLSGALGWLAGSGLLAISSFGALIAAGPIMGLLAGVSMGVPMGSITGALIGLGVTEPMARHYEELVRQGHFLVTVHCNNPDQVKVAKDCLEAASAEDVAPGYEEDADTVMRQAGQFA